MYERRAKSTQDHTPVIFSTCIDESLVFYNDVLGFRIIENCCNFRVLHAGGFFDVISTDDHGLTNGAIILYFTDLDKFRSRLLGRGIKISESTRPFYKYSNFEIKDPDQNTICCFASH